MCRVDAYEKAPFLSSRWSGGEDLKRGIGESLEINGQLHKILRNLEDHEVTIDEAVSKISKELDAIHQRTHNK